MSRKVIDQLRETPRKVLVHLQEKSKQVLVHLQEKSKQVLVHLQEKSKKVLVHLQEKLKKVLVQLKQKIYRNKFRIAALFLTFSSLIFLLTMLIGSAVGSVDLIKFTFDTPIREILHRENLKFTLLGYCIDDKCTKDVSHNFGKVPTSDEIRSEEIKKLSIDADVERINVVTEEAKNLVVNSLLDAFDHFVPDEPTNGISRWIARPIIAASVLNTLTLILLLIINDEIGKYCYPIAIILLLISFILNLTFLINVVWVFFLIFSTIENFPGIGDNRAGAAIYLSSCSVVFLLIALCLTLLDWYKKLKPNVSNVSNV